MQLSVRQIVIAGVFGAIVILLGSIQVLGFPPVPVPPGNATTLHIPVSIGGMLGGSAVGVILGLLYGVFSWFQDTTGIFKDPLISILPRLFVGLVAYLVYRGVSKNNRVLGAAIGGAAGALTNTVLVLAMLLIRRPDIFQPAAILPLLPVIVIEAAAAAILSAAVVGAWTGAESGRGGSSI